MITFILLKKFVYPSNFIKVKRNTSMSSMFFLLKCAGMKEKII